MANFLRQSIKVIEVVKVVYDFNAPTLKKPKPQLIKRFLEIIRLSTLALNCFTFATWRCEKWGKAAQLILRSKEKQNIVFFKNKITWKF